MNGDTRRDWAEQVAALKKELEIGRKWSETTARLVAEKYTRMETLIGELEADLGQEIQALRLGGEHLTGALEKAEASERAALRIRDRRQTVTRLLIQLGHDLRTQLAVLIGQTENMQATGLTREQADLAQSMLSAGEQLQSIVTALIDFTFMESDDLELESITFDLGDLVEEVVRLASYHAHAKGLELSGHVASEVGHGVKGDRTRTRFLLAGLAELAVHHADEGEVALKVEPETGPDGRNGARFQVAFTGPAPSADRLNEYLTGLASSDVEPPKEYSDVGLSLAMRGRVAWTLGGSIQAEATSDKGRVFRLWLPYEQGEASAMGYRPDLSGLKDLAVLVVDDNATNRLIFNEYFTMWGARVTEADTEAGAWAALEAAVRRNEPFRLVLVDFRKPEIDGLRLAGRLKELNGTPPPVIMMFHAHDGAGGRLAAREAGVDHHLVKPVKRAELLAETLNVLTPKAGGNDTGQTHLEAGAGVLPPLRILLAEDYEPNRNVIQRFLSRTPVTLDAVTNGQEALARFRPGKYNVILLDTQMPVMDGLETTRRIREMELKMDRPQTPIIALSAHVPPDYQAQCREAGCTDFLSKPIRKKELLSALWRCVLEGGHTLISSSYAIGAPEAETGKALVENVITVDEALRDVTVEFIRALRQQCHHLVNALKKKDFDTVLTVAKDMKEAGRGYDLEFVTEAGIDLGRLVQEKKPRAIFERTKKLYDFIKNASVEARRSKTGPGLGPEPIVVAVDEELAGVIDDYLQAVKRDVVAMGLAFSQNELEKVYLIAHDLKGSGSAYGLEKVTEIGGYICSLVRNNLRAPIAGQIEQLGAYINSVVVTSR